VSGVMHRFGAIANLPPRFQSLRWKERHHHKAKKWQEEERARVHQQFDKEDQKRDGKPEKRIKETDTGYGKVGRKVQDERRKERGNTKGKGE
jgi:hypothetical protein